MRTSERIRQVGRPGTEPFRNYIRCRPRLFQRSKQGRKLILHPFSRPPLLSLKSSPSPTKGRISIFARSPESMEWYGAGDSRENWGTRIRQRSDELGPMMDYFLDSNIIGLLRIVWLAFWRNVCQNDRFYPVAIFAVWQRYFSPLKSIKTIDSSWSIWNPPPRIWCLKMSRVRYLKMPERIN